MGRIEARDIAYPIRRLQWRGRFNFIQATVEKIDLSSHSVSTTMGIFDFDYLVLALGSVPDMPEFDFEEAKQRNLFTLKTIDDALLIRNHVIRIFEQAAMETDPERLRKILTFIISGGGYLGIQVVTELNDFIHKALVKFYKTIDPASIKIILVETEPRIVVELHSKLGAYAMKQLKRMGIEVRLGSRVTQVWKDGVEINSEEAQT